MAAQVLAVAPTNNTSVTFRAWGSAISAAIAAAGLVQTADTGQINWTTVTIPGGANAFAGYEIWRFNDALQATAPVFLKVQYGNGTTVTNPQLGVAIGTGSDGAGNLVAAAGFPNSITASANAFLAAGATNWNTTTALAFYVDSDGASSLLLAGWFDAASNHDGGGLVLVERTRNWDGTVNNEGALLLVVSPNGGVGTATCNNQVLLIVNAPYYKPTLNNGSLAALTPVNATVPTDSGVVGQVLYTYPIFTGHTPRLNAPSKHVVGVKNLDLNISVQFTETIYGVSHTFVAGGPYSGPSDLSFAWRIT